MENINNIEQLRYERAKKRVKGISGFYKHLMVYISVNLFLLALKYFRLDPGEKFFEYDTFTIVFFWGIGLAFQALSVFGSIVFFGQGWEERKINEIMEKDKTKKWE